jgi:hypothetical protein
VSTGVLVAMLVMFCHVVEGYLFRVSPVLLLLLLLVVVVVVVVVLAAYSAEMVVERGHGDEVSGGGSCCHLCGGVAIQPAPPPSSSSSSSCSSFPIALLADVLLHLGVSGFPLRPPPGYQGKQRGEALQRGLLSGLLLLLLLWRELVQVQLPHY